MANLRVALDRRLILTGKSSDVFLRSRVLLQDLTPRFAKVALAIFVLCTNTNITRTEAAEYQPFCKQNGGTYDCYPVHYTSGWVCSHPGYGSSPEIIETDSSSSACLSKVLVKMNVYSSIWYKVPTTWTLSSGVGGCQLTFNQGYFNGKLTDAYYVPGGCWAYSTFGTSAPINVIRTVGCSVGAVYVGNYPQSYSTLGNFPESNPPSFCGIDNVSTCPVAKLTAPPFNDACAEVLENIHSTQAQKNAACGSLTPALQAGKACLMDKLSRTNDLATGTPIPLKITADIRDIAYQAHLREIWDKMEDLVDRMNKDPAMRTACAVRRAEVAAEKGCDNAGRCKSCYPSTATRRSHCIAGMPASPNPNDAQHTQGKAFDVSETSTIDPLKAALNKLRPPQTIPQILDAPTNCNLNWGGTFTTNYDPVHFLAR